MKYLFAKKFSSPLNNEQGIAALVSIIMAIIILGSVAFNFIAETRQKQSGAAMTYTSTNALMIAEAGLRYTQKCLLTKEEGCPTALQDNKGWTTITPTDNFNRDFGADGNFAIRFPGDDTNDKDRIFVTSTGTFRGAQRSLSRFIREACPLSKNPITSCIGTTVKSNSFIIPPRPPPVIDECPAPLDFVISNKETLTIACLDHCGLPEDEGGHCPHFKIDRHTTTEGILKDSPPAFCDFKLSGSDVVKTAEATHRTIIVAGNFEIKDNAILKLNDVAQNPLLDGAKDTIINIDLDASLKNNGGIHVSGALTLNIGGKLDMKNNSKVNNSQGQSANASTWVEGDIMIQKNASFIGSVYTNGKLEMKNNAEVKGALFGNEVSLQNNATVGFMDNAGKNTVGYPQWCGTGGAGQVWSE